MPSPVISTMSEIYVEDSDEEFENDSLDGFEVKDSFDRSDDDFLDIDEIPESPLELQNSVPSKTKPVVDEIIATSFFKPFELKSCAPSNLPTVELTDDQNSMEKIVDIRNVIRKRLADNTEEKSSNFGSMKFKDFKEAKKALKQGTKTMSDTSSNDLQAPEAKKAKIEIYELKDNYSKPLVKGTSVTEKMYHIKNTLNVLSECVSTFDHKEDLNQPSQFIQTRKSLFSGQTETIVNNTIDEQTFTQSDDDQYLNRYDDIEEIPDSLENSVVEVLESDLEDYETEPLPSTSKCEQFIRSRPTMLPNSKTVFANETIAEGGPSSESANHLLASSVVNDTFFQEEEEVDDNSSHHSDLSMDSLSNEATANEHIPESTDDDFKMKLFKKKKNTNIATKYNHNVALSNNRDNQPRMLHSTVRNKNDRKQLHGFMCKV